MKKFRFLALIVVMMLLSSATAYADNVFCSPDTLYTVREIGHSDTSEFYIVNTTQDSVDFNLSYWPSFWKPEPQNGTVPPNDSLLLTIIVPGLTDEGGYCTFGGNYLFRFNTSDPVDSIISVIDIDSVLPIDPPEIEILSPTGGEQYYVGDTIHVEIYASFTGCRGMGGDVAIISSNSGEAIFWMEIRSGTDFYYGNYVIPELDDTLFYVWAWLYDFGSEAYDVSGLFSIRPSPSNVWYVSVTGDDSTGDGSPDNPFRTIQYAINGSSDEDTVLVQPGTYFENINFNGHNIVVGSQYLTTGDTTYILTTIIDGDSSGSVVTFENDEDTTTVIIGFTIRNGMANEGGGIHCSNSSNPQIAHNVIFENISTGGILEGGGGICSKDNSRPIIKYNIISNNSSNQKGGGIHCRDSQPTIIFNKIFNNNASSRGGGIYCSGSSNHLIADNVINGNFGGSSGGGINCGGTSDIVIENNIVLNNSAGIGAGINCSHADDLTIKDNILINNTGSGIRCQGGSNLIISYNIITENSTISAGSGITCDNSSPLILNNTISNNFSSVDYTGAIWCADNSHPILINTILWENYPNEVFFFPSDRPNSITLSYSDFREDGIETNDNGEVYLLEGNISENPLFVGGDPFDFHLLEYSPCIDAGNPYSPKDPDSSITDMGANYFHHTPPVVHCRMVPDSTDIIIPSTGGSFTYHGILMSTVSDTSIGGVWIMLTLPDSTSYGPIRLWRDLEVPPFEFNDYYPVIQEVPAYAQTGEYTYHAYAGIFPSIIVDSASFTFTKSETVIGLELITDWNLRGWEGNGYSDTVILPAKTTLHSCFPNPFNATTTIGFDLAVGSDINLSVFNLLGQQVGTLADDYMSAGQHSIIWDASAYSSGIYFYRLTAGEKTFTKRMTLLK